MKTNETKNDVVTVRELRRLLFEVADQEAVVRVILDPQLEEAIAVDDRDGRAVIRLSEAILGENDENQTH